MQQTMMSIIRSSSAIAPPAAPTMMGINSRGRVVGGKGVDVVVGEGGVNVVNGRGVDVMNGRVVSRVD